MTTFMALRRRQMATSNDRHSFGITGKSSSCSTVCSDWQKRNIKGPSYCPIVRGIHRWPMDSSHKGTVTRKWWCHNDDAIKCGVTKPVCRVHYISPYSELSKHHFCQVLYSSWQVSPRHSSDNTCWHICDLTDIIIFVTTKISLSKTLINDNAWLFALNINCSAIVHKIWIAFYFTSHNLWMDIISL